MNIFELKKLEICIDVFIYLFNQEGKKHVDNYVKPKMCILDICMYIYK